MAERAVALELTVTNPVAALLTIASITAASTVPESVIVIGAAVTPAS